jgi:hypothetical protein
LAAALTFAAAPAVPPLKPVSQQEAQYQDTPKGLFFCAACTFFRAPQGCKVVQGTISPQGWCKFFDLPD